MPAKLEIWVGVKKYQLGGTTGAIKSEAELEWLAHELKHWLGIDITKE